MARNHLHFPQKMTKSGRSQAARKKTRTREHIICDLSVNYVELRALECGYSTERIYHDYGIDMNLYTYNEYGEIENGFVSLQLKATDNPDYTVDKKYVCFPIKKSDLQHWYREIYPVIFVVYDAQARKAYWIYIQNYFEKIPDFDFDIVGKTYTVKIETRQIVNRKAMHRFAHFKECVLTKSEGVVTHV